MAEKQQQVFYWYRQAFEHYHHGREALAHRAHEHVKRLEPGGYYDLVLTANEHYAAQRCEQALDAYNRALGLSRTHSVDPFLVVLKSLTLAELGRLDEAITTCDEGVMRTPEVIFIHECKAVLLLKLHRVHELPPTYDRVLRLRPRAVEILIFKSLALYLLGRSSEGQEVFLALLALLPNATRAPVFQGPERSQLEVYSTLIDESLERNRRNAALWFCKGEVLRLLGTPGRKLDEAMAAFEVALRIDPQCALAYNGKGTILFARGRYPEALVAYAGAVDLMPLAQGFQHNRRRAARAAEGNSSPGDHRQKRGAIGERGWVRASPWHAGFPRIEDLRGLLAEGRYEEALVACERLLAWEEQPETVQYVLLVKGDLLCQMMRSQEALETYREILQRNPGAQEAWQKQGLLLQDAGRYKEALASFERGLALAQASPTLYSKKGQTLFLLGRHEEALASYRRAIAVDPRRLSAWIDLAEAYNALGRFEDALPIFDEALQQAKTVPHQVFILLSKGMTLLAEARAGQALSCLDEALQLEQERLGGPAGGDGEPDYEWVTGDPLALLYSLRGNAYYTLGDLKNALDSYDLALSLGPNEEVMERRDKILAGLRLAAQAPRQTKGVVTARGLYKSIPPSRLSKFIAGAGLIILLAGALFVFVVGIVPSVAFIGEFRLPLACIAVCFSLLWCWASRKTLPTRRDPCEKRRHHAGPSDCPGHGGQ